jgi:hypothetical protein
MLLSYERSLQPGLVGAGLIVPDAGLVGAEVGGMIGLFCFVLAVLASPFKSKQRTRCLDIS